MRSFDSSRRFPVLTALACLACAVIFLGVNAQITGPESALREWGLYSGHDLYSGAYWSLITSAFVHIQPIHLIFNLVWLWALGGAFENRFGPLAWLAFVLGSAFVSSGIELYGGNMGIGMSGVGYALFGFGWFTRGRLPEFAKIVNDQTVLMFVGWGILCIITTQLGIMNIANLAHGAGFVFGAGLGMAYASEKDELLPTIVVGLLTVASVVPILYNPGSEDWTSARAAQAFDQKRWDDAAKYYRQSLKNGADPQWAWYNLTVVYGNQGNRPEFLKALEELKRYDHGGAAKLRGAFPELRSAE
jgi:membrane associated rhomboid family serine protease